LAFAELSTVVPQSGAEYAYFNAAFTAFHKFFGPLPSFLYIWIMVLVVRPAEVAILLLTFSEYVCTPIIDFFSLNLNLEDTDHIKKLIGLSALGWLSFYSILVQNLTFAIIDVNFRYYNVY
jgi:L-type amino acid transporter 9